MFDSITFHRNPYFRYSITPLSFISASCELAMLPDVYIAFDCPLRKTRTLLPEGGRYTHLWKHIHQRD